MLFSRRICGFVGGPVGGSFDKLRLHFFQFVLEGHDLVLEKRNVVLDVGFLKIRLLSAPERLKKNQRSRHRKHKHFTQKIGPLLDGLVVVQRANLDLLPPLGSFSSSNRYGASSGQTIYTCDGSSRVPLPGP